MNNDNRQLCINYIPTTRPTGTEYKVIMYGTKLPHDELINLRRHLLLVLLDEIKKDHNFITENNELILHQPAFVPENAETHVFIYHIPDEKK